MVQASFGIWNWNALQSPASFQPTHAAAGIWYWFEYPLKFRRNAPRQKAHQSKNFAARLENILNGKQVRPSQFDGSSDAKKKKKIKKNIYICTKNPHFRDFRKGHCSPEPPWSYISYFINWQLTFPIDLISLAWFLFCQFIIRLTISCVAVFTFHSLYALRPDTPHNATPQSTIHLVHLEMSVELSISSPSILIVNM